MDLTLHERAAAAILRRLSHPPTPYREAEHGPEWTPEKALALFQRVCPSLLQDMQGARVLDFGCGDGQYAVAMAERGSAEVVGLDINPRWLEGGRALASARGVANVRFTTRLERTEKFDIVVSRNSMEHFEDPGSVLTHMMAVLKPGGRLYITFGPTWLSPYGAHMGHISRVPWIQLLFPERSILAVRGQWFHDGASRYEEVEGGLNRMTRAKFTTLVRLAPVRVESLTFEWVWGMRRLARLPGLGELLCNRITAILDDARPPAGIPVQPEPLVAAKTHPTNMDHHLLIKPALVAAVVLVGPPLSMLLSVPMPWYVAFAPLLLLGFWSAALLVTCLLTRSSPTLLGHSGPDAGRPGSPVVRGAE